MLFQLVLADKENLEGVRLPGQRVGWECLGREAAVLARA